MVIDNNGLDNALCAEIPTTTIRSDGELMTQRRTLNFENLTVEDDPLNGWTTVSYTPSGNNDLGDANIIMSDGYIRLGENASTYGRIRMQNNEYIYSRNSANTGNYNLIGLDGSDQLQLGSTVSDNLLNGGLLFYSVIVDTSPFTVNSGGAHHTHLMVDSTGGARTVILPATNVLNTGKVLLITDYGAFSATNNITIQRPSGKAIDGLTEDYVISEARTSLFFVCDANGNYNLFGSNRHNNLNSEKITFNAGMVHPIISQKDKTSGTANYMTIKAQSSLSGAGAPLKLSGGDGTTVDGNVQLISGGVIGFIMSDDESSFGNINGLGLRIHPDATGTTNIEFQGAVTSSTITQETKVVAGAGFPMSMTAQNHTGVTSTGGALNLTGGSGTLLGGAVKIAGGAGSTSANAGAVTVYNGAILNSTFSSTKLLLNTGVNLVMPEQTTPVATSAGQGIYYVKDLTPSTPYFLDDTNHAFSIKNGMAVYSGTSGSVDVVTAATTVLNATGVHTIPSNTAYVGMVFQTVYDIQFTRGGTATALNINCQVDVNSGSITPGITVAAQTAAATYRGSVVCTQTFLAIGASGSISTSFKFVGDVFPSGTFFGAGSSGTTINTTSAITLQGKLSMSAGVASCVIRAINGYITQIA